MARYCIGIELNPLTDWLPATPQRTTSATGGIVHSDFTTDSGSAVLSNPALTT